MVGFDVLKEYRGRVAMVDGAFDPLHRGHIEYFRAATALGVPLLCNVASDRYVRTKHPPLLPEDQRAAIVDAIRYITYTHVNPYDTETVLRELRPRFYVKGKDWDGRLPPEQVTICRDCGIEVVYLDTMLDSSSRILEQFALQQNTGLGLPASGGGHGPTPGVESPQPKVRQR
jgi:cytidyltransferase-like protein